VAQAPAGTPVAANQALIANLRGVCVEQINGHDYWLFRVCIGVEVTQYHDQEKYSLGTIFAQGSPLNEGRTESFKNGQTCEGKPREASATYACGDAPGIVRVREPSTCSYVIDVVHPTLCSNPNFPRMNVQPRAQPVAPQAVKSSLEDWWLEMTQDYTGRVGCAVHNTAQEPQIIFTKYSMQLTKGGLPINVNEIKARRPSRQSLHPTEYKLEGNIVTHTDKFAGTMESLSIWSVDGQ